MCPSLSNSPCRYQPACPGCPRFGQDGIAPAPQHALEDLALAWSYHSPQIHSLPGHGYRHRVRLSVRGKPGNARIGLFEARSHRLVHIPNCPVHHPEIQKFLQVLIPLLNTHQISPYDETRHSGILRGVQLAVSPLTQKLQVVFQVRDSLERNNRMNRVFFGVVESLQHSLPIHSLWFSALPQRSNSLAGDRYEHIAGEEFLKDRCALSNVYYPPDAFGQANPVLHNQVVEQIHQLVSPRSRVVEYYAGVGTIGLGLVQKGHEVLFNEIGPGSLSGLKRGLADLNLVEGSTGPRPSTILPGTAGQYAQSYLTTDTVIVDPPRKGLDPELFIRLRDTPPQKLIYLSCGQASLLRECDEWAKSGVMKMTHLSAWTYFPYTNHVETLVVLERA